MRDCYLIIRVKNNGGFDYFESSYDEIVYTDETEAGLIVLELNEEIEQKWGKEGLDYEHYKLEKYQLKS